MDAKLIQWRSSAEALDVYRDRLRVASGEHSVLFPFKALHRFGGFARVLKPGVMVAVVGMSGGMKTSFLETITDAWRQMDANDILWFGPEWDWTAMASRAVQRYGGPTVEDLLLHQMYLEEGKNNIPLDKRFGKSLTHAQVSESQRIVAALANWPGQSHQLEVPLSDIDQLLTACKERILYLHSQGRIVRFCVFDYLQLLDLYGRASSESERYNVVMGKIKLFSIEMQVISLIASQVTKTSSYNARKENEDLELEAGQNFRSDKFNLGLTLLPLMVGGVLSDKGRIWVAKNSIGRTGKVTVNIDPSRFKWIDTKEG